jgi:DNA-binding transcriptional LysR family regulator
MVNVTQLRTLCEVVRKGSFAAAGRRLGYTSSAVSQQIAGLERAVGVTLFEREARGIRATTAARYMAAQAEELLMRLDDFDVQLAALAHGARGRLRLGSFPTANSRIMPQVLASMITAFPDIDVELDEGNTGHLIAGVVEGDIDVAVVHVYALVPENWPSGLTEVELMTEDLLLVMPVGHPRSGAPDLRLEDLRNDRWISSQSATAAGTCLRRVCAAHGFVPTVAFRSDDYDVVQGLVRGGAGVAIVPEMGYTPDDGVYSVQLREWTPGRRILALHRNANSNPLLPKGIGALREACAGWGERSGPGVPRPSSEAKRVLGYL